MDLSLSLRRGQTRPDPPLSDLKQATEYVVDYSYYLGIIDYQQRYTLRKKVMWSPDPSTSIVLFSDRSLL
jgi:hypothetical protein